MNIDDDECYICPALSIHMFWLLVRNMYNIYDDIDDDDEWNIICPALTPCTLHQMMYYLYMKEMTDCGMNIITQRKRELC